MFAVPLKWNKFDLRDYLFHVYNVEVRGIRSFINQSEPKRKHDMGKIYRPQAEKFMVAELAKPFVWPKVPGKEDRKDWDHDQFVKYSAEEEKMEKMQRDKMKGKIPLRTQVKMPEDVRGLKEQAQGFLLDPASWEATGVKGGKWKEVEVEDHFNFEAGKEGEATKEAEPSER